MMERFFIVIAKGLRGRGRTPYVTLQSEEGDKLLLALPSKEDLANWEIDQELLIIIGNHQSPQTKLSGG